MKPKLTLALAPVLSGYATIPMMVLCLILLLLTFVVPAQAKGPVSATITGPGLEQPLELVGGHDRELLVTFMEQSGLWYATGDLPRAIEEPSGELGAPYVVTWVNGGPPSKSRAERTIKQFIYLHAEQGPLIHTPAQKNLEDWGASALGWFAASEGLKDTLAALGVPVAKTVSADGVIGAAASDLTAGALAMMAVALVGIVLIGLGHKRRKGSRHLTKAADK